MYEGFFGLRERPFDLTPNPRFLVLTPQHRNALVSLEFGIDMRKGVVQLIGDTGTGKTTVARALMARSRNGRVRHIYLNNPALTRAEFLQFLARSLDLSKLAETSKTDLMSELADRLVALRREGTTVALLVDEAQSLPDDLLDEIRFLTNLETNDEKLLTLILVGQPKLEHRLDDAAWEQLKQRVELRSTLTPFDLSGTTAYIWSRIQTAGGDGGRVFTAEAVRLVHERSRGIPRSISVICENALINGYADQEQPITRRRVLEVCNELDLHERQPTSAAQSSTCVLQFGELRADAPHVEGATFSRRSAGADEPAADHMPPPAGHSRRRWWWFPRAETRP
jgi:general secretion pathway protein A